VARLAAAALLALLVLAAGCSSAPAGNPRQEMRAYDHYMAAPPIDPTRKVSERDCTQPVPPGDGNLKCT